MKFFRIICIVIFFLYFPVFGFSQYELDENIKPERVFDNYIKAIGGKSNIKEIEHIITKLSIFVDDIEMEAKVYQKEPDKYLIVTYVGVDTVQKYRFNGKTGRAIDMDEDRPIVGKELDEMKISATIFFELNYEKLGFELEMVGVEKINERDVYKLKATNKDDKTLTLIYDAITGLKLKMTQTIETLEGDEMEQSTIYRDYRIVGGVKFPFEKTVKTTQNVVNMQVQWIDVKTKLKDEWFDK
jgi:hypothetical protein